MRFDMADWEKAKDLFVDRLDAGAWRHGIKTWDAAREMGRLSKFPADINTMFPRNWRKKNGDLLRLGLYYYVQSSLKNVYEPIIGKSGKIYRVRRFWSVPHGVADGETDAKGRPRRGSKEGLWLRTEDMNKLDVAALVQRYRVRATDSGPVKRYLWITNDRLAGLPDDAVVGDILDDIRDAL